MTSKWIECAVCYEKTTENGAQKKVTETYLVDALSFTEAEARVTEHVRPFLSEGCDYEVKAVHKCRYAELWQSEGLTGGDRWFKMRLAYVLLDGKSGAEKRKYCHMLVEAADLRQAIRRLDECMAGTMADYAIVSVAETKILDVFMYEPEKEA